MPAVRTTRSTSQARRLTCRPLAFEVRRAAVSRSTSARARRAAPLSGPGAARRRLRLLDAGEEDAVAEEAAPSDADAPEMPGVAEPDVGAPGAGRGGVARRCRRRWRCRSPMGRRASVGGWRRGGRRDGSGGGASMHPYKVLEGNEHAKACGYRCPSGCCQKCFAQFEANEARLCGEWAVFYHSCPRNQSAGDPM